MSKRTFRGARVLLTGASSGIGRELALELARRGASLCVLARREDPLRALVGEMNAVRAEAFPAAPEHFCVVGDVCSSDVREQAVAETIDRFQGLDVLINNAGAGATLPAEETADDLACELFDLNFFSPFELTKTALPELKASAASRENKRRRVRPLVINFSSIAGVRGTPYFAVYGAAKAALLVLTDAWRAEINASGVDFLIVTPGLTSSQFFNVLREDKRRPKLPTLKWAEPKDVAITVLNAAERGKRRIVPSSPSAKLLGWCSRFCPSLVDRVMNRFAK